jgi:hypothetical protein
MKVSVKVLGEYSTVKDITPPSAPTRKEVPAAGSAEGGDGALVVHQGGAMVASSAKATATANQSTGAALALVARKDAAGELIALGKRAPAKVRRLRDRPPQPNPLTVLRLRPAFPLGAPSPSLFLSC